MRIVDTAYVDLIITAPGWAPVSGKGITAGSGHSSLSRQS